MIVVQQVRDLLLAGDLGVKQKGAAQARGLKGTSREEVRGDGG
jgi:hypothetical protein